MKRILLLTIFLIASSSIFAQGTLEKGEKQFNAGFGFSTRGVPAYASVDFAFLENITIGPLVAIRYTNVGFLGSQTGFEFGLNGDYHFNSLLQIPDQFDVYAGVTVSYVSWTNSGDFIGAHESTIGPRIHVGGRYFFSDRFGINAELDGGYASGARFGITLKF